MMNWLSQLQKHKRCYWSLNYDLPWAELVGFLELLDVFSEHFFAFFAGKDHFGGLFKLVILLLHVALGAVVPLFAAGGSDRDLSVENMLAHFFKFE